MLRDGRDSCGVAFGVPAATTVAKVTLASFLLDGKGGGAAVSEAGPGEASKIVKIGEGGGERSVDKLTYLAASDMQHHLPKSSESCLATGKATN
jgi:hypothetical protein